MDNAPQITLLFTAFFALISVPMSIAVGLRRAKTGIMLSHGEDEDLLRRIRAHGNFVEYVPLALIALAGVEIVGAPVWLVLSCGGVLVLARLMHYAALRTAPTSFPRLLGTLLTLVVLLVLSASILLGVAGLM